MSLSCSRLLRLLHLITMMLCCTLFIRKKCFFQSSWFLLWLNGWRCHLWQLLSLSTRRAESLLIFMNTRKMIIDYKFVRNISPDYPLCNMLNMFHFFKSRESSNKYLDENVWSLYFHIGGYYGWMDKNIGVTLCFIGVFFLVSSCPQFWMDFIWFCSIRYFVLLPFYRSTNHLKMIGSSLCR